MPDKPCHHPDIRRFDGIRTCLACGETLFEAPASNPRDDYANTEPAIYQYKHLNYSLGQEIRLVTLLPGAPADPIRCEITHVNLEDDPEYDAVSYTWATEDGDDSLSRRVDISRGLYYLPVTVSCEAALRQLRRPGSRRKLWIDAICIDQSRISERNHQVGLMDSVYSKASCVRICIQDFTNRLASGVYANVFSYIRDNAPGDSEVETLRHLFSLRYFQRAWVIQEVALAQTAYLHVNDQSLLLSATVLENIRSVFKPLKLPIPGPLLWDPEFSRLGSSPQTDIFNCLYATSDCQTTDERDRIYAFLALLEPVSRALIPVDYRLDIESVYANVLVAIAASQQNLSIILHMARLRPQRWSQVKEHIMEFVTAQASYGDFRIEFIHEERLIIQFKWNRPGPWCSTVKIATTSSLDNTNAANNESDGTSIVTFMKSFHPASLSIVPHFRVRVHYRDTIQSIQTSKQSSWFMTPESVVSGIHDPESWYRWMLPFFRRIPLAEGHSDSIQGIDTEDMMEFIKEWGYHRASTEWFTTQFSCGFARPGFKVGDEVFAVDGMNAPCILRKKGEGVYQIVSECYLWAALELDIWNPGTRKGRWGEAGWRVDMGEQTRYIEIHGSVR